MDPSGPYGRDLVVVCDVGGLEASAVTVDALARLQLTARPYGLSLRLRNAPVELVELIGFMGLEDVLREEARAR